jgi:hypothetical protein
MYAETTKPVGPRRLRKVCERLPQFCQLTNPRRRSSDTLLGMAYLDEQARILDEMERKREELRQREQAAFEDAVMKLKDLGYTESESWEIVRQTARWTADEKTGRTDASVLQFSSPKPSSSA